MKRTHGESNTRLYRTWKHMKGRCNNPNDSRYKRYGARGIKVCEEWDSSYEEFKKWAVESGYRDDLTIERINVNGPYEPSNCCWISKSEQSKNKEETLYVTFNGEKLRLVEWAERLGVSYYTLHKRIKYLGFSPEQALSRAIVEHKYANAFFKFNGEEHKLVEWAKILNIPYDVLSRRIYELKQPIEKAFTKPVKQHSHSNDRIEFNGEVKTLAEWSECLGIRYSLLRVRLYTYHWAVEKAFKPNRERL